MRVVSALIAGVRGAESGTADIYKRGTTTRASLYSDFDGTAMVAQQLVLDSSGRVEVYVNEYVDVLVKDSDGSTVVEFTEGDTANNVEYQGQSFTGTNYSSGASGTGSGYPVNLQDILNLWYTNGGGSASVSGSGIDWKVTSGGVTKTLASWMGALAGFYYNVKDPTYGATGDGSTDDTAAFQAAIDAATAAGGGVVYVPDGTYRTTEDLVLKDGVSLLGEGGGRSIISIDHATESILTMSSPSGYLEIWGLDFRTSQSNSGRAISFVGTTTVRVRDCVFGIGTHTASALILAQSISGSLLFERCVFLSGSATDFIDCSSATARVVFNDCEFTASATYNDANGALYGVGIECHGCRFNASSCTSGTFSWYTSSSTTLSGIVSGCTFTASGGATVTCITLGAYVAASRFKEEGNSFPLQSDSNTTAYSYTVTASVQAGEVALLSRESRVYYLTTNTSVTLPADQYGSIYVYKNGIAAATYTMNDAPLGSHVFLQIINQGGGTTNPQTVDIRGATAHTIQATRFSSYYAQWFTDGASYYHWGATGAIEDQA